MFIEQFADSHVECFFQAQGCEVGREDVVVDLLEPNAFCAAHGYYQLAGENQLIDNHVQINHLASLTNSAMFYKGTIANKSHAVFNGKIFVAPNTQKIATEQANHNLLLSDQAQVDTKPEFEIYADDVKCAHGATVGQMDAEALFYLQSRGIPKAQAYEMLIKGFATQTLERISHLNVRERFKKSLEKTV